MNISSFPWYRATFLGNILFKLIGFRYWGGQGAPVFTVYFFLWVMLWGLCFSHVSLEWITPTFRTWVLPSSRFHALMPMGIDFHSYINASDWWGSIWHTYSTQKSLRMPVTSKVMLKGYCFNQPKCFIVQLVPITTKVIKNIYELEFSKCKIWEMKFSTVRKTTKGQGFICST